MQTVGLQQRVRAAICLLVLFVGTNAIAASTSVDTSKIAGGAHSLAMGRVSAADPGNLNSLFINPANAAALANWGVTSMYTSLLEGDIAYTSLGGAKNDLLGGTLGLAYLGGSASGLNVTSLDANGRVVPTGTTFDYSNSAITLAYGKMINAKLAAGGAVKMLSKSFGSQGSGSGYAVDLGLLFNLRENLNLGLAVQNAVSSLNWSSASEGLPLGIKGGLNFQMRDNLLLAADLDLTPMAIHAGLEYRLNQLLALRGGIERVPTGSSAAALNMALGLGLDFKGIKFDYAYFNDGTLTANSTHYFTLSFLPPAVATAIPAEKTVITPAPAAPVPGLEPTPVVKKLVKKAPAKKAPAKKPAPKKKR